MFHFREKKNINRSKLKRTHAYILWIFSTKSSFVEGDKKKKKLFEKGSYGVINNLLQKLLTWDKNDLYTCLRLREKYLVHRPKWPDMICVAFPLCLIFSFDYIVSLKFIIIVVGKLTINLMMRWFNLLANSYYCLLLSWIEERKKKNNNNRFIAHLNEVLLSFYGLLVFMVAIHISTKVCMLAKTKMHIFTTFAFAISKCQLIIWIELHFLHI